MEGLRRLGHLTVICLLALGTQGGWAQQPAPIPPALTGTLVGSVYDEETRLPIRFATIHLVERATDEELLSQKKSASDAPQRSLTTADGTSAFDGSFRMEGVPAGEYFAVVLQPGYAPPGSSLDVDLPADKLKTLIAILPTVSIAAGKVSDLQLSARRGAVIAGTIQYADGSPAIGLGVGLQPAESIMDRPEFDGSRPISPLWGALAYSRIGADRTREARTDDAGHYRIYGLPPGKYVIGTMIALDHSPAALVTLGAGSTPRREGRQHMYPEMITIFAPDAFRRKDATVFSLGAEEQVLDVDLRIDPEGLHTIRGTVVAASDGHVPNGVMVQLREAGAKHISRFAEIEDDGSFQFNYLPAGSYEIVILANDVSDDVSSPGRQYRTVKPKAIVGDGDLRLERVLLVPLAPGEKQELPAF